MHDHSDDQLGSTLSSNIRRSLSLRQTFFSRHSSHLGRKSSSSSSNSSATRSSSVYSPSHRSVMAQSVSPQMQRYSVFSIDSMKSTDDNVNTHRKQVVSSKSEKGLSRPLSVITSQSHSRLSQESSSSASSHYEPSSIFASPGSTNSATSNGYLQTKTNSIIHVPKSPIAKSTLPPMSGVWLDEEDSDEERFNTRYYNHKSSAINFPSLKRLARNKEQQSLVANNETNNAQLKPLSSPLSSRSRTARKKKNSIINLENATTITPEITSEKDLDSNSKAPSIPPLTPGRRKKTSGIISQYDQQLAVPSTNDLNIKADLVRRSNSTKQLKSPDNLSHQVQNNLRQSSSSASSPSLTQSASSRFKKFWSSTRSPSNSVLDSSSTRPKISSPTNFVHHNHLDHTSTTADVLEISRLGKGGNSSRDNDNTKQISPNLSSTSTRHSTSSFSKSSPVAEVTTPPRPPLPREGVYRQSKQYRHESRNMEDWGQNSLSSNYSTGLSSIAYHQSLVSNNSPSTACSTPPEANFNNSPSGCWNRGDKTSRIQPEIPKNVVKQFSSESFVSWSTGNADFLDHQPWLIHNLSSESDTGQASRTTLIKEGGIEYSKKDMQPIRPLWSCATPDEPRSDDRGSMLLPSPRLTKRLSYESIVPNYERHIPPNPVVSSKSDLHDVKEEDTIPLGGWF